MITEMLDLDRIEAGRMTLNICPVDLNSILTDAAERARAVSPKHTIEANLDPALPAVRGDSDRLFQVVANLLSNRVNYSASGGERNGVSGRILIVDDEPANLALLEAILSESASEIRTLNDSRQVEQVFAEFEPDIVLIDLHMPDPDGLEILRRLRSARNALGYLPVIMLTGDTGHVARNSALILGADDFLTKPVDHDELVRRVRNLLRSRELYVDLAKA